MLPASFFSLPLSRFHLDRAKKSFVGLARSIGPASMRLEGCSGGSLEGGWRALSLG